MADSKLAGTEHNMVIVEKLKKLEDDQTGLVAVINEIFKLLELDGLVYKLKVEPAKSRPSQDKPRRHGRLRENSPSTPKEHHGHRVLGRNH